LRRLGWFVANVVGQRVGQIFKDRYVHEEFFEEKIILFGVFETLEDEASMLSRNVVNQPTLRSNSEGQMSLLYRGVNL